MRQSTFVLDKPLHNTWPLKKKSKWRSTCCLPCAASARDQTIVGSTFVEFCPKFSPKNVPLQDNGVTDPEFNAQVDPLWPRQWGSLWPGTDTHCVATGPSNESNRRLPWSRFWSLLSTAAAMMSRLLVLTFKTDFVWFGGRLYVDSGLSVNVRPMKFCPKWPTRFNHLTCLNLPDFERVETVLNLNLADGVQWLLFQLMGQSTRISFRPTPKRPFCSAISSMGGWQKIWLTSAVDLLFLLIHHSIKAVDQPVDSAAVAIFCWRQTK